MTIKELLYWATRQLIGLETPRLDAELLLCHVLKKDQSYLITHDYDKVSFWKRRLFKKLISKRKTRLPLAYILGGKEFYGLWFEVDENVLVPRPDTEILVENVIAYLKPGDLLLDVGTGSGCIPIAVLKHQPGLRAIATDISTKALAVARRNLKRHQLDTIIELIHSNLLESVPIEFLSDNQLVVTANLPYLPLDYQVNAEAQFEPGLALYAKNNGLELYQKLLDQLARFKPRAIFLECYEFQMAILAEYSDRYRLKASKNMLGKARMLMLERMD